MLSTLSQALLGQLKRLSQVAEGSFFSDELGRGVEQRAAKLITEERSLRDLRQALELTQESLAERLGVNQENVSRLEQRSDLLLSTLSRYVGALLEPRDVLLVDAKALSQALLGQLKRLSQVAEGSFFSDELGRALLDTAAKLITEERSLRDLRQALELTQESLAER